MMIYTLLLSLLLVRASLLDEDHLRRYDMMDFDEAIDFLDGYDQFSIGRAPRNVRSVFRNRAVAELPRIEKSFAFKLGDKLYSSISFSALGMSIEISPGRVKCGSVIHSSDEQIHLNTYNLLIDDRAFCKFPIEVPGKGVFLLAGVLRHGTPQIPDTMKDLEGWCQTMERNGHKLLVVEIKMVTEAVSKHLSI